MSGTTTAATGFDLTATRTGNSMLMASCSDASPRSTICRLRKPTGNTIGPMGGGPTITRALATWAFDPRWRFRLVLTAPHPAALNAAFAADFRRSRCHHRGAEVDPSATL